MPVASSSSSPVSSLPLLLYSRFQVRRKEISSKGQLFKKKMRKVAEPRVMMMTLAMSIFLILLPLIYATVFSPHSSPFNLWKQIPIWGVSGGGIRVGAGSGSVPSSKSINIGGAAEDDSLKSLLGRLLPDATGLCDSQICEVDHSTILACSGYHPVIGVENLIQQNVSCVANGKDRTELENSGFACKSDPENDVCVAKQSVWMKPDGVALNVYLQQSPLQQMPRMVMPYVKRNNDHALKYVKHIKIQTLMQQSNYTTTTVANTTTNTSSTTPTSCDVYYDVPAVVFTTGLIGNVFHEFNEIILPLFLTTQHFRSQLRFVITDFSQRWVGKYSQILSRLSDYEVINASQDKRVHCFPGAVVGIHYQDEDLICKNSHLPVNCSMSNFKQFLREAFGLKFKNVAQLIHNNQDLAEKQKPVLVLLSRRHSRRFLNEGDMVRVANELGFQVIVASPELTSNLDKFSGVVNRCSVLVGAHGAGLTNELFMPEGAVMVQMVPLGLQWASTHYYGTPLGEVGVHYLEYQISPQESTLSDVYGPDHPVIKDPDSINNQGWRVSRPIYIEGQDLRLDISKFKDTLVQALRLLGL